MRVAASRNQAAGAERLARLAIRVGDMESVVARGFSALVRTGSLTLFRWPADVIAAGYTSKGRPRHFVRMESGQFPQRLLRAYEKLRERAPANTQVSLVEIRALHAHLAWAHTPRRGAADRVIPLLPSMLDLKPGKEFSRAHVEERIRAKFRTGPLEF